MQIRSFFWRKPTWPRIFRANECKETCCLFLNENAGDDSVFPIAACQALNIRGTRAWKFRSSRTITAQPCPTYYAINAACNMYCLWIMAVEGAMGTCIPACAQLSGRLQSDPNFVSRKTVQNRIRCTCSESGAQTLHHKSVKSRIQQVTTSAATMWCTLQSTSLLSDSICRCRTASPWHADVRIYFKHVRLSTVAMQAECRRRAIDITRGKKALTSVHACATLHGAIDHRAWSCRSFCRGKTEFVQLPQHGNP